MAANAAQLRMAKRKKDAVKQKRQGWDSGNDAMGTGNDPDAQPWWNIFLGCCAGGRDEGLVEQNMKEIPKDLSDQVKEDKEEKSKESTAPTEGENSNKPAEEENSKPAVEEKSDKADDSAEDGKDEEAAKE